MKVSLIELKHSRVGLRFFISSFILASSFNLSNLRADACNTRTFGDEANNIYCSQSSCAEKFARDAITCAGFATTENKIYGAGSYTCVLEPEDGGYVPPGYTCLLEQLQTQGEFGISSDGINPSCCWATPAPSPSPSPSPSPILAILPALTHVTQSVEDFSFAGAGGQPYDLVLGKTGIVQAFFSGTNINPSDTRFATVQIQVGSNAPITQSLALNALAADPAGKEVDFIFNPTVAGSTNIVITIDPQGLIQPVGASVNIPIAIHSTRNLNVGFVAVDGCTPPATNCYGGHLTEFSSAVQNMGTFIQATYPIADQGSSFNALNVSPVFSGTVVQGAHNSVDYIGINKDLLNLGIIAKLSTPPLDYVGGVVPAGYFNYHHETSTVGPVVGISVKTLNQHSFLVEESAWTGAAHEISHLYGRSDDYNLATGSCSVMGTGYWPTHTPPIPVIGLPGLMCAISSPNNLLSNWMDFLSYNKIFQALESPANDPDVLLVTGLLMKNGSFQSSAFYHSTNGTLSSNEAGNFSINVKDISGNLLSQTQQQIDFKEFVDPIGEVDADAIPIVVSVPFPATAAQIDVTLSGKVIASVSPNSQLLTDAIEAIPPSEFKRAPKLGELTLLSETKLLTDFAKNNRFWVAILIAEDLKLQAQFWLNSSFIKTDPRQTNQSDLINLLNTIITHLESSAQTHGQTKKEDRDDNDCKKAIKVFSGN